jgi:DNA polymerase phi
MGSKRKRTTRDVVSVSQPDQKKAKTQPSGSSSTSAEALDKSPFSENPTVDERKREASLYELLGSDDVSDRINAADAIVSSLLGGDGVPLAVLERHLNKRLFRGLASGRNSSRLGFSLVLTEVLGQLFGEDDLASSHYPDLTFDKVLDILVERTQAIGNSGQEERGYYFGQLFGIECFVRAGILFRDKSRWISILDLLLKLSHKKVWLRSQCGWVIAQAVPDMSQKTAEKTLQNLHDKGWSKTPEGVGISIIALDHFPHMKVPPKPWLPPLSPKSLIELPGILKDSGKEAGGDDVSTGDRKQKQSNWTAQLHFVWDVISAHFTKLPPADATEQLRLFWTRVVDGKS